MWAIPNKQLRDGHLHRPAVSSHIQQRFSQTTHCSVSFRSQGKANSTKAHRETCLNILIFPQLPSSNMLNLCNSNVVATCVHVLILFFCSLLFKNSGKFHVHTLHAHLSKCSPISHCVNVSALVDVPCQYANILVNQVLRQMAFLPQLHCLFFFFPFIIYFFQNELTPELCSWVRLLPKTMLLIICPLWYTGLTVLIRQSSWKLNFASEKKCKQHISNPLKV